ncbi:uncharacterized protein LOC114332802 isoform X2 [Diabrotica virgifera virgifera]|uniref:Uncharacterized protein n=1 Tax=Diabrotica virgifera virgifera TaxID=50390 RepID=A0ABM5L706_DIAVI|nr:uncharacterized protein LOC114332802 isoform X2 [Diabrotica virgifera virgifera]
MEEGVIPENIASERHFTPEKTKITISENNCDMEEGVIPENITSERHFTPERTKTTLSKNNCDMEEGVIPENITSERHFTPEKSETIAVQSYQQTIRTQNDSKSEFSTPFKNAFYWPETASTSQNKKTVKRKITPAVAACSEYIEYQRRVEQEKKSKLEKAALRKMEKENRLINENKKKTKSAKQKKLSNNGKRKKNKKQEKRIYPIKKIKMITAKQKITL